MYLHVPFCRCRCSYCDFAATTELSLVPAWYQAVCQEVRRWQKDFSLFDTFYLGGGTPSLLQPSILIYLFEELRRFFRFTPDAEITLEANPEDVFPENLRLWRSLGINRLSLGLQSLEEEDLRFLGRRHTGLVAEKALRTSLEAGFDCVSVDLISGLPGQTEKKWERVLTRLEKEKPAHISCYQLTIKKSTILAVRKENGERVVAEEKQQEKLFLQTSSWWRKHGYLHYEVSSFAAGERYKSRHNLKYWRRQPYLGLGPAAHSFSGNRRWWNVADIRRYCEMILAGCEAVAGREELTPEQERLEEIFLGLRTAEGVPLHLLSDNPQLERTLSTLQKNRLLSREGERIRPTPAGYLFADVLPLWLTGELPVSVLPLSEEMC